MAIVPRFFSSASFAICLRCSSWVMPAGMAGCCKAKASTATTNAFICSLLPASSTLESTSRSSAVYHDPMGGFLTIGQVSAQTGESRDTIRYYERIGLVPRPLRTPAGYRHYREGVVNRLALIRNAQAFG